MKKIAIIPARGGSKRVPKKNIRLLGEKPLIAYTIQAAQRTGIFDRIIVSTDDQQIAEVGEFYGAEVPFLRDPMLADDYTPISLATLNTLEKLEIEGEYYDHVAQLMGNCPLVNDEDIKSSYAQFIKSNSPSQISVTKFGWFNPWWAVKINDDYSIEELFQVNAKKRSQDLPPLFCPTGAIWWAKVGSLHQFQTFHCQGRTGWEIPWWRSLDIDTEEDLRFAKYLLQFIHGDL